MSPALGLPMFKVKILFLTISILMTGCAVNAKTQSDLFGVWKSNESKTLDSMRSVYGVSEQARELFENDFFGHLIAEYGDGEGRYYFDREEDNVEGMKNFKPYELLEENESVFTIKYFDDFEEKEVTKTLNREGECYYLLVSKWNFREYFCKVETL